MPIIKSKSKEINLKRQLNIDLIAIIGIIKYCLPINFFCRITANINNDIFTTHIIAYKSDLSKKCLSIKPQKTMKC